MTEAKTTEQVRGDCPDCGKNRWANILGEKCIEESDDDAGVWASNSYRLLECAGCKTPYYQHIHTYSEDVGYETGHPIPKFTYFPA